MEHKLDVIADGGIPFRVAYDPNSITQGTDFDIMGTVVFYDRRWDHYGDDGREVNTFSLGQILSGSNKGFILDGSLEVDARNMATIRFWLRNLRDSIRQGALV